MGYSEVTVLSIDVDIVKTFEELEEEIQKFNKLKQEKKEIDNEEIPSILDSCALTHFKEYIITHYDKNRPIGVEAFYQITSWQWSAFYEGIEVYYENFYQDSDYKTILRVTEYIKEIGYTEFSEYYVAPAVEYEEVPEEEWEEYSDGVKYPPVNNYPEEMYTILKKTEEWAGENIEMTWNFYVDVLMKIKSILLASQKENQ